MLYSTQLSRDPKQLIAHFVHALRICTQSCRLCGKQAQNLASLGVGECQTVKCGLMSEFSIYLSIEIDSN